jgi:hypothetical protein
MAPLWLHAGVHASAAFAVTPRGDHGGRWLRSRHVTGCAFVRWRGPHAGPADVVEVQPGLLAAVDQVDAAQLALLRGLLATAPVRESAPRPPAGMGWFARLALDEPGAIQLFAPGDGTRSGFAACSTPPRPGCLHQAGAAALHKPHRLVPGQRRGRELVSRHHYRTEQKPAPRSSPGSPGTADSGCTPLGATCHPSSGNSSRPPSTRYRRPWPHNPGVHLPGAGPARSDGPCPVGVPRRA